MARCWYVKLLQENDIGISMTEKSDPLENAIAERVNGIIKEEYLLNNQTNTLKEAKNQLKQSVMLYNTDRPHLSIGNHTPSEIHQQNNKSIKIEKLWKNYYRKKLTTVNLF